GPAVAGGLALDHGADLVDRAGEVADHQAAVGAHARGVLAARAVEDVAGAQEARLDDLAEGDARFGLLRSRHHRLFRGRRDHLGDARLGDLYVLRLALDADVVAAKAPRSRAGGA